MAHENEITVSLNTQALVEIEKVPTVLNEIN